MGRIIKVKIQVGRGIYIPPTTDRSSGTDVRTPFSDLDYESSLINNDCGTH